MQEATLIFKKSGFPSIKVFEEHFEIKAIDYWEYRTFKYSEIKEILYFNPNNKLWNKLYIQTSLIARKFFKNEPWILKIINSTGGDWIYKTSNYHNSQFNKILKMIRSKNRTKTQKCAE